MGWLTLLPSIQYIWSLGNMFQSLINNCGEAVVHQVHHETQSCPITVECSWKMPLESMKWFSSLSRGLCIPWNESQERAVQTYKKKNWQQSPCREVTTFYIKLLHQNESQDSATGVLPLKSQTSLCQHLRSRYAWCNSGESRLYMTLSMPPRVYCVA